MRMELEEAKQLFMEHFGHEPEQEFARNGKLKRLWDLSMRPPTEALGHMLQSCLKRIQDLSAGVTMVLNICM